MQSNDRSPICKLQARFGGEFYVGSLIIYQRKVVLKDINGQLIEYIQHPNEAESFSRCSRESIWGGADWRSQRVNTNPCRIVQIASAAVRQRCHNQSFHYVRGKPHSPEEISAEGLWTLALVEILFICFD